MQEGVFDEVAQLIELFVILALLDAVFLLRNNDLHALLHRFLDDGIRVVCFIRQQSIGEKSVNQADSRFAIRPGTLSESDSNRQTMRIHGQMYLGVEPPFVRDISWFPPTAPAAWGCTLQ